MIQSYPVLSYLNNLYVDYEMGTNLKNGWLMMVHTLPLVGLVEREPSGVGDCQSIQ